MRVSGDSPRHALITQASSASRAIPAATTDPDSDPPCPVMGLYPQGNVPGAEPLSSTQPDCTTSHPAAAPLQNSFFLCAGKTARCCGAFCRVVFDCLQAAFHYCHPMVDVEDLKKVRCLGGREASFCHAV